MIRTDIQGALEDLEGHIEEAVVNYRGMNWPCIAGDGALGMVPQLGPMLADESLPIIIRKNAVPFPGFQTGDNAILTGDSDSPRNTGDTDLIHPERGHLIIYQQKEWQIERVSEDPTSSFWLLSCGSPDS